MGTCRRTKVIIHNSHGSDDPWPYRNHLLGFLVTGIDELMLVLPRTLSVVV